MKLIKKSDNQYQAASHENQKNPGVLKKILLQKTDFLPVGKPQMINWALLPAGSSFEPHFHEDMQEVFIVVKGDPIMEVGKERVRLYSGDTMVVDVGEVHIMVNATNDDVEYIVIGVAGNKNGKTVNVNQA